MGITSSLRRILHEKGIPKRHGHRKGHKYKHNRRTLQASIRGVLGVRKRNGKFANSGGAHALSGVEDDGGEDSEEPDD